MIEATKRLLRTLPGPGMNRVLVGHRMPLEMATGRMFPRQRAARGGNGRFPSQCDSAVAGNDHGRTCRALGRITGRFAPLDRRNALWRITRGFTARLPRLI